MNKKSVKILPENVKIMKVLAQEEGDCLHDCEQKEKISGRTYQDVYTVCHIEKCTYRKLPSNAQTTSWF